MKKHLLLILIIFFARSLSYAQYNTPEDIQSAIESYTENYFKTTGEYSSIYRGKAHRTSRADIKIPYFTPKGYQDYEIYDPTTGLNTKVYFDKYSEGKLIYNKTVYPKVMLRLDLFNDELVIQSPIQSYPIVLDATQVEYAEVQGYEVHYLSADKLNNGLKQGYYAMLYSGEDITVMKKESYTAIISATLSETKLSRNLKYYVCKDNNYYTVKNKKSILKVLNDRNKDLDNYIRSNRINFDKDNIEDALIMVAKKYEELNK